MQVINNGYTRERIRRSPILFSYHNKFYVNDYIDIERELSESYGDSDVHDRNSCELELDTGEEGKHIQPLSTTLYDFFVDSLKNTLSKVKHASLQKEKGRKIRKHDGTKYNRITAGISTTREPNGSMNQGFSPIKYQQQKTKATDQISKVKEQLRNEFQYFQPSVQFSRMESKLDGSISIICRESRAIMLVLWSVKSIRCNDEIHPYIFIQTVPVINCSSYSTSLLLKTGQSISDTLSSRFKTCDDDLHEDFEKHFSPALQLYIRLSRFIISSESDVRNVVLKKLFTAQIKGETKLTTMNSYLNAAQLAPGRSLDHLDIFSLIENAQMEMIIQVESSCGQSVDNYVRNNGHSYESDTALCQICFDSFDGDEMNLVACSDHKFCASCWKDLIRSAVSSGEAVIHCPYFRCSNMIGFHDAAHILLNGIYYDASYAENALSTTDTIMNLMRFQIEHYISTYGKQGETTNSEVAQYRFCTTPSCNHIFSFPNRNIKNEESQESIPSNGSNIILCKCGTSVCGDCSYQKGASHLGLTCNKYKKLRTDVDSGRIDAEYKSLLWLQNNTDPCPKCNFPISKNGGCNHVSCKKCEHYFCWICKGPGNNCGYYHCKANRSNFYDNDINTTENNEGIHRIHQLMAYINTDSKYQEMTKRTNAMEDDLQTIKLDLFQTLLWAQAFQLSEKNAKNLTGFVQRLTYILCIMLSDENSIDKVRAVLQDSSLEEAIFTLKEFCGNNTMTTTKKQRNMVGLSTRKIQAMDRIEKRRRSNVSTPSSSFGVPSLSELVYFSMLCNMNTKRLRSHARDEICKTVDTLLFVSKTTKKGKIRKEMQGMWMPEESRGVTRKYALNTKQKMTHNSWKKNKEKSVNELSSQREKKPRWKGKNRVKTRRILALDME